MKIKDILESIKKYIAPLLIALLLLVLGINENVLPPWTINLLPPEKLVSMVIILIILTLYLSSLLYQTKKFTLKFGILWNKNKEPHCPACRTPLSNYREHKNPPIGPRYILDCIKCNKDIQLIHDGVPMRLNDIKKLL